MKTALRVLLAGSVVLLVLAGVASVFGRLAARGHYGARQTAG